MQLAEVAQKSVEAGEQIYDDVMDMLNKYNWDNALGFFDILQRNRDIRGLGGYCAAFTPGKVCEIGTCRGASTIWMSYASLVDTYDIDHSNICNHQLFQDQQINPITLQGEFEFLDIPFLNYDLIFCDIGNHTGVHEEKLHNKLIELGYRGHVFYDDINWPGLSEVWNKITNNKLYLNWHDHFSENAGFGVVEYV